MRIGITCYATFGGSGIIATEIGLELARRGHQVHFICAEVPWRFDHFVENIFFHEVEWRDYPLLEHSSYALALASKMVEVARYQQLDLFHVHYAIPHATSAHLAREILIAGNEAAPKLITTLHGTDITLVGSDHSLLPITRFSIERSQGVTTPSEYLRFATYEKLGLPPAVPIEVIPNFVDTDSYAPLPERDRRRLKRILHNSNFRPLKRADDVLRVFSQVNEKIPCELVFIGDGPERSRVEKMVHELGLAAEVRFLGKQHNVADVLKQGDVFVLPSVTESFGLAALEALSCGVPVVASDVGGLPEVIQNGECGFLTPLGDLAAMSDAIVRMFSDEDLHARMSIAARKTALEHFQRKPMIDRYEAYYRKVLG